MVEWSAFYVFRIFMDSFLVSWGLHSLLTPKYSFFIFQPVSFVLYILGMFIFRSFSTEFIQLPFFIILTLLLTSLFYKDKFSKKVFFVFIVYSLFFSLDIFSGVMLISITQKPIHEISPEYLNGPSLYLLVFYAVYFICLKCLSTFFSAKKRNIYWKEQKNFLLIPICQIVTLFGLVCCANFTENKFVFLLLILSVFLTVFATFFMFRSMNIVIRNVQAQEQIYYLHEEQQLMNSYYDAIIHQIDSTRILRHDMANHLQTIRVLLDNKNYEQAGHCFIGMNQEFEKTKLPVFCENVVVNAVLYHKILRMEKEQIEYTMQLSITNDVYFNPIDLTALFSNLLDNAIDGAVQATAPRCIQVSDHWAGRLYTLKVVNSKPAGEVKMRNHRPITTKDDRLQHGYGSKIMESVADKYEGSIQFINEGEQFVTTVLLQIPIESTEKLKC